LEQPESKVSLMLSYTARPEAGAEQADGTRAFTIPLVRAREATRADTKVRIWSDPGVELRLANREAWDDQPAEAVAEKESLPAPVASLNVALALDGKTPRYQTVDAGGKEVENGSIIRLNVEPDLYHKPVILDVRYQIAPGRTRGNHFLQSVFYPPLISVPRPD